MEKTNEYNARTTRRVLYVDDIAARDALSAEQKKSIVFVIDATADNTVTQGSATYAWVETKNAGAGAWVKFPEDFDLDVNLTILKEYVYDELMLLGCSINLIEVTKYVTLSRGVQPLMRVIFNRNDSHYFTEIERTSDNECTQFDIDVSVECPLTEDQLPPLNSLNNGDGITIYRYPRDMKAIKIKEAFPSKSHPDDGLVIRLRHRVRGVFNCKKHDNSDVAKELVTHIFEISKL